MTRLVWRLQAWLNRRHYLSQACSVGDHDNCRLVNTYSGKSCVCARCHHKPRLLAAGADCGPWLHIKGQPLPSGLTDGDFVYHDDFFGVRVVLIEEAVAELRELGILGRYALTPTMMRDVVWHVLERTLSTMVPRADFKTERPEKPAALAPLPRLGRLPEQKDRWSR